MLNVLSTVVGLVLAFVSLAYAVEVARRDRRRERERYQFTVRTKLSHARISNRTIIGYRRIRTVRMVRYVHGGDAS